MLSSRLLCPQTGHYAYESETTQASLSNILTVEMNNANGSAGAASGWDLIRVNQLNITAKSSGSYTVNGNDTLTHNNNGRYVIRLKSIPSGAADQADLSAEQFDPLKSYRWKILESTEDIAIEGKKFDPSVFIVDTADFEIAGEYSNKKAEDVAGDGIDSNGDGDDDGDDDDTDDGGLNILFGGRFAVELGQDRRSLYVNYISPIQPENPAVINVSANGELLWNINDVNGNYQVLTDGTAGLLNRFRHDQFFSEEYEQLGHDKYARIDFSGAGVLTSDTTFNIRVRTLSSTRNALSLYGAGSFGPLYNFDFSKPYSWKIAGSISNLVVRDSNRTSADNNVNQTNEINSLISEDKIKLDTSNFVGAGMDSLRKELTLEVSNGSLILKYTPRFIETPESKYSLDNWETDTPRAPGENRINLATRTGDVIGLQLSRFFAAGASDFQIVTGDNGYGVSGAGDLLTKANEFKIIRDQGGVTGDVLYFIPYITDKIATSVQQQTDRGFTGITKFKVTAMVNGSSAAKVFRIRVDAGYGRLYLDSSVGNDATNNVSDIIKVKQRLKYFGMPVTSVPFATVNSNDINGIRHALTDYTSITVDASAPGDFPGGAVVNDKLYQALGIFGAAIKGVANSMKDNKAANPDIPAGGNYGDYNFSGIFQPGVVTTIDPDNYKDTIYQWLSSSNAPFWMEVVEPSVKIGGVDGDYRGDFNYTPMSSGYGVADALQSERFGTNWAANVIYFMSKQYDGQVRVSGLSFINGGDSAFHRNHESGTSIDVSTSWTNSTTTKTRILNALGGYTDLLGHDPIDAAHIQNSVYSLPRIKDKYHHYHSDIRVPILNDMFYKMEAQAFYELKSMQMVKRSNNTLQGADSYRLHAVNGMVLTDDQINSFFVTNELYLGNNTTLKVISQNDFQTMGRFCFMTAGDQDVELTFVVTDEDPFIEDGNQGKDLKHLVTVTFEHNTNAPVSLIEAQRGVGAAGNRIDNNPTDVILTKARLNNLGFRDNANNQLVLTGDNAAADVSFIQALTNFQKAIRAAGFVPDGKMGKDGNNAWYTTGTKLWSMNAPRIVTVNGISARSGNITSNYVKAFADAVPTSSGAMAWNVIGFSTATALPETSEMNTAINDRRAFRVCVQTPEALATAINEYFASDASNSGTAVEIRKVYVNQNIDLATIAGASVVPAKLAQSADIGEEEFIVELIITNLNMAPTFEVSLAAGDLINQIGGELFNFGAAVPDAGVLPQLGAGASDWFDSFFKQPTALGKALNSSGDGFSAGGIFDFSSSLSSYFSEANSFGGATYEGMAAAVKTKLDFFLSLFQQKDSNIKVYFDESAKEIVFDVNVNVWKSISNDLDFGSLSDKFKGSNLPLDFKINFEADFSFGINVSKVLNKDPASLSLADVFIRIDKLGISASSAYGGDYASTPDPSSQSGGLNIGTINFNSTLQSLSLEIGTDWYVRKEDGSTTVSFQDIADGTYSWYHDNYAKLDGALELTAVGEDASGKAVLTLSDEDLFEKGNTTFTVEGTLTLPNGFKIGDDLLSLGVTTLEFSSAAKTVNVKATSADLKIGNDLLTIGLSDSVDDADLFAVDGTYNYETGDFNLLLDNWNLGVKGLVNASGHGLTFKWGEKASEPGREIVGFQDIANITFIPLNKSIDNLIGIDTEIDGQTVKRVLSIKDNGFMFAGLSKKLTDNLNVGNGLVTIDAPTLVLENIVYTKDSAAGLTGRIGITTTAASVKVGTAITLTISDSTGAEGDVDNLALDGCYDLATKKFNLNADTTTLDIAGGKITSTIKGLEVNHYFGDSSSDPNEEVISVAGDITLSVNLGSFTETITVQKQSMVVNGQSKIRSLSLTGNSFMLGNASAPLGGTRNIGAFTISEPKVVLQNFGYNRQTGEYTGKVGLTAEGASFNSGSGNVAVVISKTTGDAIELLYDLNGGFTGTIDRIDFIVKDNSNKEVFLASATGVTLTVAEDGSTSLDMTSVNAIIPDLSIPSQSLGTVRIANGNVVVTHNGVDYSLPNDIVALIEELGKGLLGGDDDAVLTQEGNILKLEYLNSVKQDETWDLSTLAQDYLIDINLGDGVDKIKIDSDLNLGNKDLSITSDYITINDKTITGDRNYSDLQFNAYSDLRIGALDIIGLLLEAFKVDLNGTSATVDINYDSLINRLLGRSEAIVAVTNDSSISSKSVKFTANVNVTGESTGLLPVDFQNYSGSGNEDGKASKFKIQGLTTALASVQARALVDILNSVITTGQDLELASNVTVDVRNTAVAEAQEDGEENDEESTEYDAVVALAIINSKSIASVGGNSTLNITGNITIDASNRTTAVNTADGRPEGSGKAYGGSVGLLIVNKETQASIGSNVTFGVNPASVSLAADSVTTLTNNVTAAAGGAKENNAENTEEIQDNGGETGSGKVTVAGAAALTIVNENTTAYANMTALKKTEGDLNISANSNDTITTIADGTTVDDPESDSNVGVGAAVALNVVNVNTTASAANVSADKISLDAVSNTTVSAQATSGSGGSNVGIAGSVAVNTIDQITSAVGSSELQLNNSELSIKSDSTLNAEAKALPKDTGAEGEKVGIGASFALNDLDVDTSATDNGATISGTVSALKIDADTLIIANTETKAGSSATGGSGVAISPSVAINVVRADTKADHSAAAASSVTGDITVTSDSTVNSTTKALASADGNVAVGASIGVAVIKANNAAEVGSSLTSTGGKVDVAATGKVNSFVNVEATPRVSDGSKDKKADDEANKQLSVTRLSPADQQSSNSDSTMQNQNTEAGAEGGSNSNGVGVSAAVGVNVVTYHNRAEVLDGADISAAGDISIKANEDVETVTQAVGAAINTDSGSGNMIGAAAALNVTNKTNSASVLSGSVLTGDNITVAAETTDYNKSAILAVAAGGSSDGLAFSVTAGVNVVNSETSAILDEQSQVNANGTAAVRAGNSTDIQTLVLAAGVSQSSGGIGAAVVVNVLDTDVAASVEGNVDAKGDVAVSAVNNASSAGHKFTILNQELMGQQNVEFESPEITAIAAAGGGSQSGVGIAGSFIINHYEMNTEAAVAKTAKIITDGNISVSAVSDTTIKNVAGSLSASGGSVAVGPASDVTILNKNTVATVNSSSGGMGVYISARGKLDIKADSDENILSTAGQVSAADTAAIGVTASILVVDTETKASAENMSEVQTEYQNISAGDVEINASDDFTVTQIVAGVSAAGNAAITGGAAVLVHKDSVDAIVGDRTFMLSSGSVKINAESSEEIIQIAANVAASGGASVGAGSIVANLNENTNAKIGTSDITADGTISLTAKDETGQIGIIGRVAVGQAGIGAGGNVIVIQKDTIADIGEDAVVTSTASDIIISAESSETMIDITAGISAGAVGVGVNATVNTADISTNAGIGDGANVTAEGTVALSAHDDLELDEVTAGAAGGSVGISLSGAVSVIKQETRAVIGDGATVTGLGNGSGVNVSDRFGTLKTEEASNGSERPDEVPVEGYLTNEDRNGDGVVDNRDYGEITYDSVIAGGLNVSPVTLEKDPNSVVASEHDEAVSDVALKEKDFTVKGVTVKASNNTDVTAVTAGVGAGAVGISLNAGVTVIENTAEAIISDNAQINADNKRALIEQKVHISAGNNLNYTAVAASFSGGVVGVAPAANVAIAKLNTRADVKSGAVVNAKDGGVIIAAEANERLLGISFGGAGGLVGIGGSVQVIRIENNTGASIGNGAIIETSGDLVISAIDSTKAVAFSGGVAGGLVGIGATVGVLTVKKDTSVVIDGDINAGNVTAEADTNDYLFQLAIAGGFGLVGIGGAVSIMIFDADTSVQIGIDADIDASGAITIKACNASTVKAFTLGMGAGYVGVGGSVSVGNKVENTTEVVVEGNLNAGGMVSITADSDETLDVRTIAGTAGAVAVSAGVSSWSIGGDAGTSAIGNDVVNDPDYPDAERPEAQTESKSAASTGSVSDMLEKRQGSTSNIAPKSSNDKDRDSIYRATNKIKGDNTFVMRDTAPGTKVTITNDADITGDNIKIAADGEIDVSQMTPSVSVGAVAVGGAVNILNIETHVDTSVGGTLVSEGDINISSSLNENIKTTAIGGQGGLVAAGAAFISVNDDSSVKTTIDETGLYLRNTSITGKNVTVSSVRNIESLNAEILKPSTGAVVVGGSVIKADITGAGSEISVGTGAQIMASEDLLISSDAHENVNSHIVPVAVGAGVFNGVQSEINVDNSAVVVLGDTDITGATVKISADGNHADKATLNSIGIGLINGAAMHSSIVNVSDASIVIDASSISGFAIQIVTTNNFDWDAYDAYTRPSRTTITGSSISGAAAEMHLSEVSLGEGEDRFGSDISITGKAKISGVKDTDSSGSPKISMLALTNIYLYEHSTSELTSLLGNAASVMTNVDLLTSSNISVGSSEIDNANGQVSIATMTNSIVYNIVETTTAAGIIAVSHASADTNIDVNNHISIVDANVKGNEIYIASGRALGNSQELAGDVNKAVSHVVAKGHALGAAGLPVVSASNDVTAFANGISISGTSVVQSYGNTTIDAKSGRHMLKSMYQLSRGSVAFFPLPDFDEISVPFETQNSISITGQAQVRAGVDSDMTVLFLTNQQAESAGITGTVEELSNEQILALGLTPGETTMSAKRLTCDIDMPVAIGTVVKKTVDGVEYFYKYEGIDLNDLDYNDRNILEPLPSEYTPPYFFYDESVVSEKVSLQRGDIIKHNGIFYNYQKFSNLELENFSSTNGWTDDVSEEERLNAVDNTIGKDIKTALSDSIVLIRPKDMQDPQMSYVNYANMLERRLKDLDAWIASHFNNGDAFLRYTAVKEMLINQLAELPYDDVTFTGTDGQPQVMRKYATNALVASFDDIHASRGSIIIDLDSDDTTSIMEAVENDRVSAGSGADVTIHNSTPISMEINNIFMKSNSNLAVDPVSRDASLLDGGRIYLNSKPVPDDDGIEPQSETVTIEQDAVEHNLEYDGHSQLLLTDIFVTGTILNETGNVVIKNRAGSINITGEIIALEQEISSKTSVNINTPGFYTVGANPKLLTEQFWADFDLDDNPTQTDGFPNQASNVSGDENEGERYTRTGGTIRAMGNITIIAGHINVNGTIESGISNLGLTITREILPGLSAVNPFIRTRVNGTTLTTPGAEVQYTINNINKTVEIEDIVTRSGNITLCGDIFNTNPVDDGGNIRIAHGYANISMVNLTEYTLIVNKIDTSKKNTGSITIYDTRMVQSTSEDDVGEFGKRTVYKHIKSEATGQYEIHRTVHNVEKNDVENLYEFVLDTAASGVVNGSETSYKPLEGMFLIWVEGQGMMTITTETWEKRAFNLTPGWTELGDKINDALEADYGKKISETVAVDPRPVEVKLEKSNTLRYLQLDDLDNPDVKVLRENHIINESNEVVHNYFGQISNVEDEGPEKIWIDPPKPVDNGWLSEEKWITTVHKMKGSTTYYSHYLYASNEVGVDFSGGNQSSAINIQSKGNVILQGNTITPENSTMNVTSEGEIHVADNVIFSGVTPNIQNINKDITLTVVISDKPLDVSATGNITINAVSANGSTAPLIIGSVRSSRGNVIINSATGVVARDSSSIIQGEKVYINAAKGCIGEETLALRVNSNVLEKNEGGVAAIARDSVYITEAVGDLRLIKQNANWTNAQASVHSLTGEVHLTSPDGSLLNGFSVSQTTPHVQGSKIVLTTGGAGEVKNLQVGTHESLYVNSVKDVTLSSEGDLNITNVVSTSGDIVLRTIGNAVVTEISAENGTAAIDAGGSVLNGRTDNADLISAITIVLNSETGTIGTLEKAFAVDSSNGTVTAEAELQVYLTENSGVMNVNSVVSKNSEVVLQSRDGIADANSTFDLGLENFGLSDLHIDTTVTDLNVAATAIHLVSSQGGIGTLIDAIETDVYGERAGRIFADAGGDISIEEIVGSMNTGIIVSGNGTISAGTRDSADSGEDVYLDSQSAVRALNGNIHLRAGDNLYHLTGAVLIAGQTIYIYGDFGNADSGIGSEMVINGSIAAGLIRVSGDDDNDTVLINISDSNTVSGRFEVYGGSGDDSITSVKLDTDQVHLYGQDDNDSINAESMTNRVHAYGGAGNDAIRGGLAGDVIFGGSGNDTITGDEGTDFIFGDGGVVSQDSVIVASEVAGEGNDVIDSGNGADVVFGDNGTISVTGLHSVQNSINSLVYAGNEGLLAGGDDQISGGAGEDLILGGTGSDLIDGGDGDDMILGDEGSFNYETINNAALIRSISSNNQSAGGDDTIYGGTGVERILGGTGKDTIDSGNDNGSDIILGDDGKILYTDVDGRPVVKEITSVGEPDGSGDSIYSGFGSDVVMGGAGDDFVNAADGRNSIILGDNGTVVYNIPDLDLITIDHVRASEVETGGNDTLLTGSEADIILGGTGSDNIQSGTGQDIILGDNGVVQYSHGNLDRVSTADDFAGGDDTIVGGNDSKIILGGYGDDSITSLNGNDIVFGDGGFVDFNNGVLLEANGTGVKYGGEDIIDTGIGLNTVIGGLGDDTITTGVDRTINAADVRDLYSNEDDVVIADNGRRTFNGTGLQERTTGTLSFNFQGQASKGIAAGQIAGAPESKVSNWNNIQSYGPGTFGNDPSEIFRLDNGDRLEGLRLSWGGKENHRTDSIELNSYLMESYNLDTIRNPATGQLSPGDGYLFAGGLRTSAPNTQSGNKLEVEMDGLNKYFSEYSVIVYLDAPNNVSSLIQNPWDSTLGRIYGKGESIRKVNINSANKDESFFVDDAADANNPAYNTFNGRYIKAVARDAVSAFGKYANYVVFEGLTDDRFVITITDGVLNVQYNGRDLPSIAGIQVVGKFHAVDTIQGSPSEAGGNDTVSTSGGNDIVIGGAGSDNIATFGDIRDGIDDSDTVIGDNGIVTVVNRTGWPTKDDTGSFVLTSLPPEIIKAQSSGFNQDTSLLDTTFNDLIFTGNGNDVVIGGDGQDRINTQRQDDLKSDIWTEQSVVPEVMQPEILAALQDFETEDVKVMSLNFSYSYNDPSKNDNDLKVSEGQYAGVVAAKNWNNVILQDQLNPVQYPNPYTNTQFKMSDGTLASGLKLNLQAREPWGGNPVSIQGDRSNAHDQIDPDSDNANLFKSYLWAQKQQQIEININNIGNQAGFGVYDVYVYIDGDNERTDDDNYVFEVAGGDISNNQMSRFYLNDWRGQTFNGEFKEVTATSYTPVNNGVVPNMEMVGNYVVFRNVTAKDFAIRIKNVSVGDQFPLNMPCISAVQIVSGEGRTGIATDSRPGNVARNGDYDKDVVVGDNGKVKYTLDVPYGTNDNLSIAQNKAYEVISNELIFAGTDAATQSDYIVTGRNQDIVIGGNGNDAIDSGTGNDVVTGDNAEIQMVDYNPIGLRQPMNLKILDTTSYDSAAYIGKPGTTADQMKAKISAGQVAGVKIIASDKGGNDIVDAGRDNDLLMGQEGNDLLIGNEGDDVIYDTVGDNKIKDAAYASKAAYESDMADVLSELDDNGILVVREFITNDFGNTSMTGVITAGLKTVSSDPGTPGTPGTIYDLSSLQDTLLNLTAGQTVTLTSSNWAGKYDPYWNPNIALDFNNNGSTIPNLELSWIVSGVAQNAVIPSGTWYYRVNEIPDNPNNNGVYTLTLKALSAGSFKVRMANA